MVPVVGETATYSKGSVSRFCWKPGFSSRISDNSVSHSDRYKAVLSLIVLATTQSIWATL